VQLLRADRVASGIVAIRGLRRASVFVRLAQREMQVQTVVIRQSAARSQGLLHRLDVGGAEADRFQIGEAPPGLAQRRLKLDRATIGAHALCAPPDRLQGMSIAQPDARTPRSLFQDGLETQ